MSSFPLPVNKDCEIATQSYAPVHRGQEVEISKQYPNNQYFFIIYIFLILKILIFFILIRIFYHLSIFNLRKSHIFKSNHYFQSECASAIAGEGPERNNTESKTPVIKKSWNINKWEAFNKMDSSVIVFWGWLVFYVVGFFMWLVFMWLVFLCGWFFMWLVFGVTGRFAGLGALEIPIAKIQSCFVEILSMIIIHSRWLLW